MCWALNTHSQIIFGGYVFISVNKPVAPCEGLRSAMVSHQIYSRRGSATMSGTEEEETVGSWLEKAKKRNWLWRWLNDINEIEAQVSIYSCKINRNIWIHQVHVTFTALVTCCLPLKSITKPCRVVAKIYWLPISITFVLNKSSILCMQRLKL